MTKLAVKRGKPARKKPARKRRAASPRDTLFAGMDMDLLRRLLADQLPLEGESLEDMVDKFLSVRPERVEEMPDEEAMSELAEELDRLRVDANGGDREAREELKAVRERIDKAARRDEIHPGVLILLGRLFAGSQVDIGDAARASMGRMVAEGLFYEPGEEAYRTLVQPLLTGLARDPFALHAEIRSLIAVFPSDYKVALIEALAADSNALARRAAVGFLLDPDEPMALAAIKALGAAARKGALDPEDHRRIDTIGRWLSPAPQSAIESAFGPTRVTPASPASLGTDATFLASVCDGSGASALFASVKRGSRYLVASVMTKAAGVVEAQLYEDLSRDEADAIGSAVRAATPTAAVLPATFARLLGFALGRNLSSGLPPPFALIGTVETIGLGGLEADASAPAAILESLTAAIAERDRPETIGRAHRRIAEGEFGDNWFEAGEAVDAVLQTADSVEAGAQALLEDYLPGRRDFWASLCARSALALKDSAGPGDEIWKQLALVGRDILGGVPLNDIPLMEQIAEKSATAYSLQR